MEKDIALGSVGDLDLAFAGGKAKVELKVNVEQAALSVGAVIEVDASKLIDKLFAAIEAASPPGAVPIEEGVKSILKSAVAAL